MKNTMKTMRKSKTGSSMRRMNGQSRGSKARKGVMAFGAVAAVAVLSRMLRSRRVR